MVAILRGFSDLHPRASNVWNTGKSHASPEQEVTAGHSLSRQGHPTIAHRFSGGTTSRSRPKPRQGRQKLARLSSHHLPRDPDFRRRLPSLTGLVGLVGIAFPPLKRWATVGCPSRDNDGCFLWKNGPCSRDPAAWKSCSRPTGFCVGPRSHSFGRLRVRKV